ncbi:MAG: LLM class flavin-dependent oxidoreductase [Acetobacteraceae bacterium]
MPAPISACAAAERARPLQGHPVIVQADASPAGLALAVRTADVFLATGDTPDKVKPITQALRAQSGPRVLATIVPLLADTQAEAEARAAMRTPGSAPSWPPRSWPTRGTTRRRGASGVRPGMVMAGMPFIGTAAGFADWLAALFEDGVCGRVQPGPAVLPLDLAHFVNTVSPLLQARGLARRAYAGTTLREAMGLTRPLSQYAAEYAA